MSSAQIINFVCEWSHIEFRPLNYICFPDFNLFSGDKNICIKYDFSLFIVKNYPDAKNIEFGIFKNSLDKSTLNTIQSFTKHYWLLAAFIFLWQPQCSGVYCDEHTSIWLFVQIQAEISSVNSELIMRKSNKDWSKCTTDCWRQNSEVLWPGVWL